MAIALRQSTASQEVPLGYFLDSLDGNTEETGLTIANTDIKLWKNGATTLANKNSGGATHISNGIYYAVLDATDTDTLGSLIIFVHVAGALAVRVECEVLSAVVYDSWIAGTDNLQVDLVQWLSTAPLALTAQRVNVNVGAMAADVVTAAAIAADALGASELAADAASEIATAVWASATRLLTAGTNIVLAKGVGVTGFNDLDAAGVRSAVGLAAANLDTQLTAIDDYVDTEVAAVKAVTDKLDTAMELDGAVYRFTTNALEQAPTDAGLSAQEVRDAMKLAPTAGVPAAGSIDLHLDDILEDTAVIGAAGAGLTAVPWNSAWDAEVQSEVQDAVEVNHLDHLLAVDYDPAVKPGVATALLNELIGNDAGVSQFTANALELAPTDGVAPTAEQIADAVWDEASTGHIDAGKAGQQLWTDVDAILIDTNELQTDNVPGLIAALNDLDAAAVNAEVDTALADIHLDHLLAVDYDPAVKPGVATALLNELIENDAGVSRYTANALEQAPTDGAAPTAGEIADAVWDEASTGHVDAGKAGAQLWTDIDAILVDTNELQTDLVNGGRLDLLIDAIKAKTDNLPADPADDSDIDAQLATIAGYVDTEVAAIKTVTDKLDTAMELDGAVYRFTTNALEQAPTAGSAPSAETIADTLLNRDLSLVADTNDRTPLNALRSLRNKVADVAGVLTVYKEDDTTTAWTAATTRDANANLLTAVDPA